MKQKATLVFLLSLFSITFFQVQAQCNGATFQENNGIAVMEAENASLPSNWKKESSKTPFTGNSYLIWRGSNSFPTPGNAKVTYTVKINNPGKYRFIWRNVIGVVANHNPTTEHNDSWLKIQADDFYGQKGSSKVWPKGSGKTPNPHGASAEGFFKVYANSLNWNWSTFTSDFNGHFVYAEFDSPGVYTITLANRSNGHIIDRMVLYKENQYSASQAQSLSRAQTTCGSGTPPPPPPPGENDPPTVSITNPNNGANFNAGSNITVNLNSNDPDGSVTKHEIFVNNTRVDNDGSTYSPHTIQNIQAGSYAIRAKVTDNDGATAESTVNITVGGGNPPPPPPPPPGENDDPTVVITNPADGESFSAGSTVTVNASSNDSDGSVVKHQVYVNGVLKDTDGTNYTPYKITNIANGNYAIKVTVTDNDGATASATVNISVGSGTPPPPPPPPGGNDDPTVSITTPANGESFDAGDTVTVRVSANDSDGSIVKHQVYVNDVLKDTDGANYTPHKITNIADGNYAIRVTVTDNDGATASATVNISVGSSSPPPPPASGISLTRINPTNNSSHGPLFSGNTLNIEANLNIRANVSDSNTKSVYFELRGAKARNQVENVAPYALFGDISGNYNPGNWNSGSYTLKVETYSGLNKTGSLLESKTYNFNVSGNSDGKSAIAYPNPVKSGNVNVKLPETLTGVTNYVIISPSGTEVERGSIDASKMGDAKLLQIDSATMKNDGVYYLVIQANYDVFTVPIIKQ